MKVMIIGAGATGLLAASYLNKYKIDYDIYEKNKSVGSKILASGNGRCNISNINISSDNYNNDKFNINNHFLDYFRALGCSFYADDEGRIYPTSNCSKTILNILLDSIDNNKIYLNHEVLNVNFNNENKILYNDKIYDYLIIACGSSANIIEAKAKNYFNLFNNLNIKLTEIFPSLAGFKVKENVKILDGLRIKANVKLYNDSKCIHEEVGEINYKKDGLSGIVIMNMSFMYNKLRKANCLKNPYLSINYMPKINKDDFNQDNLKYRVHPLLYDYYLNNKYAINYLLNEHILHIENTYDIKNAQVVSGGVNLDYINDDFSYKKNNNIFIGGECLDIDGLCGGYNLTFAFYSASKIIESIRGKNV